MTKKYEGRRCPRCNGPTTMMVQALVCAPGELDHRLPKKAMRRADVHLQGVLWETADFLCKDQACGFVQDGHGNHMTQLKAANESVSAENKSLREEVAKLQDQAGSINTEYEARMASANAILRDASNRIDVLEQLLSDNDIPYPRDVVEPPNDQ